MTIIRVQADYDCYPTWVHDDGDVENVAPDSLSISPALAEDLDRWGDEFDGTLDRDNPMDSGFPSAQDEENFAERGERLARRLHEELGDGARVVYFDLRKSARVAMS